MILVLNRKCSGCTTIAYNISKLFQLPLYIYESSYLYKNEEIKRMNDLRIIKTPKEKHLGVYDLGSNYKSGETNSRRFSSLCKYADVAVIPFEISNQSIDKTIETMTDIRQKNPRLKIVLIANRLDNDDDTKDFLVKNAFMEYFKDKLDQVYPKKKQKLITFDYQNTHHDMHEKNPKLPRFENSDNIKLTYLRNSYALCGIPPYSYDLERGEYFLDLFKYNKKLYTYSEIDDNLVPYDYDDKKESYEEFSKNHTIPELDFKFFRYLFFLAIQDGKTQNENEYYQEKDFVTFRNRALTKLTKKGINKTYPFIDDTFKDFNKDHTAYNAYAKLIKDFAFIIYSITTRIDKHGVHEPFFDIDRLIYPENANSLAMDDI